MSICESLIVREDRIEKSTVINFKVIFIKDAFNQINFKWLIVFKRFVFERNRNVLNQISEENHCVRNGSNEILELYCESVNERLI